jgi:hypothetical protein
MRPTRAWLAAAVVLAIDATAWCGDASLFQALERERFGASSYLSINAQKGAGWDFSSANDFTVSFGDYWLSMPGSCTVSENGSFYCKPYRLLLTRAFKNAVLSGGLGYGYDESKSSSSAGRITCIGPGIFPFYCIDTVWKGDFSAEWQRRHSFFAGVNGLAYLSPRTALVAGLEAAYKPKQGFRYEEEYINHPPEVSVRYFDYNKGAWEAGVSAAMGVWRTPVRFHREWSALLAFRWDFEYQKSLPLYNKAITSYGYAGPGYPDPTISYVGENHPSHRLVLAYSIGDANPDILFLVHAQKPFFSMPLPVIDELKLSAGYSQSNETFTYVNRWTDNGPIEYGTTNHYYNRSQNDAAGDFDVRCYVLRYLYLRAAGAAYAELNDGYGNLDYTGKAGGGFKFAVWKGLVADMGCVIMNVQGHDDFLPTLRLNVFTVSFKLALIFHH